MKCPLEKWPGTSERSQAYFFGGAAMQPENSMGQTKDDGHLGCSHPPVPERNDAGGWRAPGHPLRADAGPRDHIVQLYQDQHFLNRAVCRFAASALANGEGV